MGWTLTITDGANIDQTPGNVDLGVIRARLQEAQTKVEMAYTGYPPKKMLIDQLSQVARSNGCYHNRVGEDYVIKYRQHVLLNVAFAFAALGDQPDDDVTCPSCRQVFVPDPNDPNDKWTEAHNVIPASLWSKIVPAAIRTLVQRSRTPGNEMQYRVMVFDALDDIDAHYGRNGFNDGRRDDGPSLVSFIAQLCTSGSRCDGPGASGPVPRGGAQCPRCEMLHGPLSLICRMKTVNQLQYLQHVADDMRGKQFSSYFDYVGLVDDSTPERITANLADLVVDYMLANMRGTRADDGGNFLKAFLTANRDEFKRLVQFEAIYKCSTQKADEVRMQTL